MKPKTDIIPGQEGIYEGDYFLHWEIGHLSVEVGSIFWGLLSLWREKWLCYIPKDVSFPDMPIDMRRSLGIHYHLVARGTPSEKGHFGHMGICDREFRISEVIELRKKG